MLKEQSFDAPIPGMSMTHELGARPWQSPPQYSTVDEVIEYYLDRMSSEEFTDQLVDVLEMGVPVTTLANTIQMGNVMDGTHNLDVGMLVMPFIMEMIMLVGESSGVKYDSGMENPNKGQTRDTMLNKVRMELEERMRQKEGMFIEEDETMDMEEEEEIIAEEEPMGLMSRREQ